MKPSTWDPITWRWPQIKGNPGSSSISVNNSCCPKGTEFKIFQRLILRWIPLFSSASQRIHYLFCRYLHPVFPHFRKCQQTPNFRSENIDISCDKRYPNSSRLGLIMRSNQRDHWMLMSGVKIGKVNLRVLTSALGSCTLWLNVYGWVSEGETWATCKWNAFVRWQFRCSEGYETV